MRRLRRLIVQPPTLASKGSGGQAAADNLQHWENDKHSKKMKFPERWRNEDVIGALLAQHWRLCAYCSKDLDRGDWGDVEHFRPKGEVYREPSHGGYWWLAYKFSNYLLSCSYCNRARKRTKFPLLPGQERITFDTSVQLSSERHVLIEPTIEVALEDWFVLNLGDDVNAPYFCYYEARADLDDVLKKRIADIIEFFKLDNQVKQRNKVVADVFDAINNGNAAEAKRLASRFRSHSLVAKLILKKHAPELLPDETDDLMGLLEEILIELEVCTNDMNRPGAISPKKDKKELLWSLAALWHDPPDGSGDLVETTLKDANVIEEVRPLREQFIAADAAPI